MTIIQAVVMSFLPSLGATAINKVYSSSYDLEWYGKLVKPSFYPPDWVFPIIWPLLYISMGFASYLVMQGDSESQRNLALGLYVCNLILNWAWSPIFFGKRKLGLAAFEMMLTLANIGACIFVFSKINITAAYLMLPYFAWLSYASILTTSVWTKNKIDKKE